MIRTILSFGLIFVLGGISVSAEEYVTGRVSGAAPVAIDGDLADWDALDVVPVPIAGVNGDSQAGLPRDEADLSASFRAILDDSNVYIAVRVADDALVFGEERSGEVFRDDCVEVLLYGPETGSRPLKIWVSRDKYGEVRLEGREAREMKSYPDIWTERGAMAALKPVDTGYRVEIMIPRSIPEMTGWLGGEPLGMNVAVYDDDDGGKFESIRQWADISVQAWNTVSFAETLAVPVFSVESGETVQEIELVVSSPDGTLEAVDPEMQIDLARAFERAEFHGEALTELEKTAGVSTTSDIRNTVTLARARNHYFLGQYDQAKKLCQDLLAVETDNGRRLDADMILLSIERKQTALSGQ